MSAVIQNIYQRAISCSLILHGALNCVLSAMHTQESNSSKTTLTVSYILFDHG